MGRERFKDEEWFDDSQSTNEVSNSRRPGTLGKLAAGVVVLGLAYYGGGKLGEAAASKRFTSELKGGEVVAERALIEPISFECSAWSVWDVEAKYDYQVKVADKKIPGFGATATFEDPTKVNLRYCIKGDGEQQTEVVEEDGQTLVKIPIDNVYLDAQIPTGNKQIDFSPYSGMKTVGGGASILSGLTGIGCSVVSLGKKKEECSKIADAIDNFKRDYDTNKVAMAEAELLEATRQYGAESDWEDVKLIYRDKTKIAAVKKAGGDSSAADKVDAVFVDKNGEVTDKLPEFKDPFDDLRKRGVLDSPDVDITKTKFKANNVDKTAYEPKYVELDGEVSND